MNLRRLRYWIRFAAFLAAWIVAYVWTPEGSYVWGLGFVAAMALYWDDRREGYHLGIDHMRDAIRRDGRDVDDAARLLRKDWPQ